jgi:hypothetical protein
MEDTKMAKEKLGLEAGVDKAGPAGLGSGGSD